MRNWEICFWGVIAKKVRLGSSGFCQPELNSFVFRNQLEEMSKISSKLLFTNTMNKLSSKLYNENIDELEKISK